MIPNHGLLYETDGRYREFPTMPPRNVFIFGKQEPKDQIARLYVRGGAKALGLPNHRRLNDEIFEFGRKFADVPIEKGMLQKAEVIQKELLTIVKKIGHPGTQSNISSALGEASNGSFPAAEKFDKGYRDSWKRMDELVPTSFVRQFMIGLTSRKDLALNEYLKINAILEMGSMVRLPTIDSGHALMGGVLQHPTEFPLAMFSRVPTQIAHGNFDVYRKNEIKKAMEKALAEKMNLLECYVAGIQRAIEFTLSAFTAPVKAENVFSHSLGHEYGEDSARVENQMEARETMKKISQYLGEAVPRAGRTTPLSRQSEVESWVQDLNRPLSPFRVKKPVERRGGRTRAMKRAIEQGGESPHRLRTSNGFQGMNRSLDVDDGYAPLEPVDHQFRAIDPPPIRPVAQPSLRRPMPSRKSQIFDQEGRGSKTSTQERQGLKRALGE